MHSPERRPIRILHVIERAGSGGAFRGTVAAAKYSSRGGTFAHTVLSLRPPLPEFIASAQAAGVAVAHARTQRERDALVAAADVVQVEWWNNAAIDAFVRAPQPPCRLVVWVRVNGSSPGHGIPTPLVQDAEHVMTCCRAALRVEPVSGLRERNPEKVTELFAGADFEGWPTSPEPSPRSHDGFVAGYVGTVDPIKMHPRYVAMSAAIDVPKIRFVVYGEGLLDELRAEAAAANAADRFEFRGYVRDIPAALADFDVFGYPLCPDTYAASEKSLQEAMFCGVPPVVFPYGGVRDLVIDGETGCVVQSEEEYRAAIEFLYRNPAERSRLGANARQWASRQFAADRHTGRLHEVYQRVLRLPKRARAGAPPASGAERFIESLRAAERLPFRISAAATCAAERIEASLAIVTAAAPVHYVLMNYRELHEDDPLLALWAGVIPSRSACARLEVPAS